MSVLDIDENANAETAPSFVGTAVEIYDSGSLRKRSATTFLGGKGAVFTLDATDGISAGDLMAFVEPADRRARVEKSVFRDLDATGVLVRARDSTISGNLMDRIYLAGVSIMYEGGTWLYGPAPHGVTVRNNALRDVAMGRMARGGYGGIHVFVRDGAGSSAALLGNREIADIVIDNNVVFGTSIWGLLVSNATTVTVQNNSFSRTNCLDPIVSKTMFGVRPSSAIWVRDSAHVSSSNNFVSELGSYASTLVSVDTSADASTVDLSGVSER